MSLYQKGDPFICKKIPASLDEGPVTWFQQLPLAMPLHLQIYPDDSRKLMN